jgi:hypothetical protein
VLADEAAEEIFVFETAGYPPAAVVEDEDGEDLARGVLGG